MVFKAYGVFIALAVITAVFWTRREAKKAGRDPEKVWEILLWVLIGGLAGARFYHVVHYWWYYSQDWWRVFWVWQGGLGIYGGLAGGLLGYFLYWLSTRRSGSALKIPACRQAGRDSSTKLNRRMWLSVGRSALVRQLADCVTYFYSLLPARLWEGRNHKSTPLLWLDIAAPGIALGQAVGRLGNVVNGELLPFAVYEMGWDLAVFLILVKYGVGSRKYELAGRRFLAYLFLYALGRFFLEFTRTDNVWRWGSLAAAQVISLFLVVSLVLLGRRQLLNPSG